SENQKRKRCSYRKKKHGKGDLSEITSLRRKRRRGAERRAGARGPHYTEKRTKAELTRETFGRTTMEALLDPVARRSGCACKQGLQEWTRKNDARRHEKDRAERPKRVVIKAERKTNRREEQTESDEGKGKPSSKRSRADLVLRYRRAQHHGEERKDARRQD